jgi:hypothetical protein
MSDENDYDALVNKYNILQNEYNDLKGRLSLSIRTLYSIRS